MKVVVLGLFLFSKVSATYNPFTDGPDQVLIKNENSIFKFLIVTAKFFIKPFEGSERKLSILQ